MKYDTNIPLFFAICALCLAPMGCSDDNQPSGESQQPTDTAQPSGESQQPTDTARPDDKPVETPPDDGGQTSDPKDDEEDGEEGVEDDPTKPDDGQNPGEQEPETPTEPVEPGHEANCTETLCNADGVTLDQCIDGEIEQETCEFGCSGNACNAAECTVSTCVDDKMLSVCNEGHALLVECDEKCENDSCAAAPECTQTQCNGNTLEICTNGTLTTQACEYGCQDAKCVVPECTADTCDGSTQKACIHGKWSATSCDNGCRSGKCMDLPYLKFTGDRTYKILLTGNSLTHYGQTVILSKRGLGKAEGRFAELAKYYHDNLSVTSFTWGSAGLKDGRNDASNDCVTSNKDNKKRCMSDVKKWQTSSNKYGMYDLMTTLHPFYYNYDGKGAANMEDFYKQDYVIIQERTGSFDSTETYAKKIKGLFPPETQFGMHIPHVFYDTAYDGGGSSNKTLAAAKKLHKEGWLIIPWGKVIYNTYKNKYDDVIKAFDNQQFKKADFVVKTKASGAADNKHQNYLTGYLEADAIYSVITGRSAIASEYNVTKEWPSEDIDKKYVINNVIKVPAVKSAIARGYYAKTSDTNFGYILLSKPTVNAIQDHINKEIRVFDNQILYADIMTNAGSFFPGSLKMMKTENITDGKKSYDRNDNATYAAFTWAGSSAEGKDFKNATHYDENGQASASGKYLCGFTYKLARKETVSLVRIYNPATTLEINGFDILLSNDNKNWTVVYSGKDLVKGLKYKAYSTNTNTNYISASFYPTEAQYVRFALTEPRYQPDSTMSDADIKKLISDYNAKYGQNVDKVNTNPESFRIVEMELYRYTKHWE